jgi:hypothetical protein
MMEEREQFVWMQRAIDGMTAWLAEPDSIDFPITVWSQFSADPGAAGKLFVGLFSVAGLMLKSLEDATGTPQRAILQNFSRLIEATGNE